MVIFINGAARRFYNLELSYSEVVKLSGKPVGPLYTVTYKKSRGVKTEGSMSLGDVVKIQEGTIFNVALT